MATVTLRGSLSHTTGDLPENGTLVPDARLTRRDLTGVRLSDYRGRKVLLNVFPSIDTSTCARSVREFNEKAAGIEGAVVLCISRDLPFAQSRFCGAEGIDKVEMLSDFKDGNFGKALGLEFADGPFEALHSRAVVVLDTHGRVVYSEQVPDISNEPDYQNALKALEHA
ncbi:thiol peroxidase [Robiginitalea sp. SC105]|uniref:thiol peroxidase n=1 Tax=Robiginitalea sp. SC105 TaxID=2762332 RepID=UPI001639E3B3|nr:thiol peroxidase [Robiginitalea sp. SC105]MBC2840428.1 thiol peroxidase [Robiginitalea sp. SC105]